MRLEVEMEDCVECSVREDRFERERNPGTNRFRCVERGDIERRIGFGDRSAVHAIVFRAGDAAVSRHPRNGEDSAEAKEPARSSSLFLFNA